MNEMTTPQGPATTPADWASNQEVRWCPGCGDYAILKAIQRTMPQLGARPETTVFVSGIGCSSRFPYYMETYGFHTIHGRAPAVATGIKLANPELDVWIVTGDGDGLSIGGNHLLHLLRRNLDCQVLLFNNEIYGLTKGQYSPTSRVGTTSPSSPWGSVERPVYPCEFALGAGARFIARVIDTAQKQMPAVLERAYRHKGTSFVEIYQNCVVYNDGRFEEFTDRRSAAHTQLWLEHGKPMLFAGGTKGLRLNPRTMRLEVADVVDGDTSEIVVHDETNKGLAKMLVSMRFPEFPVALGVIFCDPRPTFEQALAAQRRAHAGEGPADLDQLLRRGPTWEVRRQG
ncbi:MAG: 2-oxoacid:ferredoxin oxidoreductase subunit beta [Sphingomonadaceae bacterium]|uniref:2-oxoacid:ferredoxin oxidoreductase subunit beta n=1 Tax=Thermaurantiacus sp. TaxID=2820283 RepID=UPI00298EDE0A|nr:2-oxoacid:ferredoxin oxidoreductase subunit beta [Thermaurantiacus sp.]MCS6986304.1 2-oxoacid:ferredoxin oxidoreductase subunit beta [Sphingomonadaceae bacterium]MDW8415753.1 2-oxoacid:ferredoxin oxidoreductase subunit beta [Thermaurantiacus sp.]